MESRRRPYLRDREGGSVDRGIPFFTRWDFGAGSASGLIGNVHESVESGKGRISEVDFTNETGTDGVSVRKGRHAHLAFARWVGLIKSFVFCESSTGSRG